MNQFDEIEAQIKTIEALPTNDPRMKEIALLFARGYYNLFRTSQIGLAQIKLEVDNLQERR